ncbi:MAG: SAM-dependent methyltransferase [Planctomycetota bacterium]
MNQHATPQQVESALYDREYYERSCGDFDLFAETGGRVLARKKQFIVSLAMISPGMRVLDAGCGRGEFSAHFAKRGAVVDSVDYSAASVRMTLETAGRFGENIFAGMRIARCDVRSLPYSTGAFDRIVMADIVEHMHERELDEAFAEMARVLAPDGVLVVHTAPNRWRDVYNWPFKRFANIIKGKQVGKERRTADELELHVNIQSPRTLARHLEKRFAYKVWTMRPELLYPMSAYERFRAKDPLNAFGSRDIWAIAVNKSRGGDAVRRHIRESFYANRMIVMGENDFRFASGGFGDWKDGTPVVRPLEGKARLRIPVDGHVREFRLEIDSERSAGIALRVGNFINEKPAVNGTGKQTFVFDCAGNFRRDIVPVRISADAAGVSVSRIGFE